jgi:hypothetical protein
MFDIEIDHYTDLALRWAPIDYQYIRLDSYSDHYSIKKDLVVPVDLQYYKSDKKDFEFKWDTRNIRNRLREVEIRQLKPVAYYSVAETASHYYILYSFYHADDDTHPNDMEGCLVILEKQESSQLLLGIITVAHYGFWKYAYKDNLLYKSGRKFREKEKLEVDEELDSKRPLIQQEKGKHGLYALGTGINIGTKILRWFRYVLNIHPDVIVLYPNKEAFRYSIESLNKGKNTPYDPSFYYELVHIMDPDEGLWGLWKNRPNSTFDENGKFHGGSANPPWLWGDGRMWNDPAGLVSELFKPGNGRKNFDLEYSRKMDGIAN